MAGQGQGPGAPPVQGRRRPLALAAGGVAVAAALCISALVGVGSLAPRSARQPAELAGRTCSLICEAAAGQNAMAFSHSEQVAALVSAGCCAGAASPMLYQEPRRRLLSVEDALDKETESVMSTIRPAGKAREQALYQTPLANLDGAFSQGWVKDAHVADAPGANTQHAAPFLEPTMSEEKTRLPGVNIGGVEEEAAERPTTIQSCCAMHAKAPQQQLAWTMSFQHHEHSPWSGGVADPYAGGYDPSASSPRSPSAAALLARAASSSSPPSSPSSFSSSSPSSDSSDGLWGDFLGAKASLQAKTQTLNPKP